MARSKARNDSSNHLLCMLSGADFARLELRLSRVVLELRLRLEDANKPITHIYFPENGIVSVVAEGTRGRQSEIGLIGREGMTGLSVVMGSDRSVHASYVQVAGQAQRIGADDVRQALRESASMRQSFLHYAQAFMVQTAHTAVANGRANIEERLARWLLMAHDRLDGNEVPLTHEFLALMLSVRRAGVTVAVQGLSNKGLIAKERGQITVTDRPGLEAAANGLYGIPEAESRRLMGWNPRKRAAR
jgi:CRP-like cAMP-binding protein